MGRLDLPDPERDEDRGYARAMPDVSRALANEDYVTAWARLRAAFTEAGVDPTEARRLATIALLELAPRDIPFQKIADAPAPTRDPWESCPNDTCAHPSQCVEACAAAERVVYVPVYRIRPQLSPREVSVLKLAADGLKTPEVAAALGISIETEKSHRKKIIARLHARNTTHAVSIAHREGLL